MSCTYLTRESYLAATSRANSRHWKSAEGRWSYHEAAVQIAREIAPASPDRVLELGTMGVSIVEGSHTMDYAEKWNHRGFNPTFLHDARRMPWPVADKAYDLFIALRVFHHLLPVQEACFHEALRIARHVVIVVPAAYHVEQLKETSQGITEAQFTAWNGGRAPGRVIAFPTWIGNLFYWSEADRA